MSEKTPRSLSNIAWSAMNPSATDEVVTFIDKALAGLCISQFIAQELSNRTWLLPVLRLYFMSVAGATSCGILRLCRSPSPQDSANSGQKLGKLQSICI